MKKQLGRIGFISLSLVLLSMAAGVDTTSMPMTNLLMPKLRDTATALSVMNLAPWFRTTKPTATMGMNSSERRLTMPHPLLFPLFSTWHSPIYWFPAAVVQATQTWES